MEKVILGMVKDDRKRVLELREVALMFENDRISWTPSSITYTVRYVDDVSGGIDKGPCILDGLTDAAKDSLVDMLTLAERTDGYFDRMEANVHDQLTSIGILNTLDTSLGQELAPEADALKRIPETAEQCRVKLAQCIWKRIRDIVDNFDAPLAEKRARKRQKNIKDSLQKEIRIHKNNIQQAEKDNAKRTREIKRLEKLLKQIEG